MAKHKQTKACEFSERERKKIYERDNGGCIFCSIHYRMNGAKWQDLQIDGIMHYISRKQGGLGIKENGALGCHWHHRMLDNGKDGYREEMLELFRQYLQSHYQDWNESKLTYDKWGFFKEVQTCSSK